MFWGLNLKSNRKYTQTTSKSFHISQAALDAKGTEDGSNKIYISWENQKFLICTLQKDKCEQVMLDLNFSEGDTICFHSVGNSDVSLSGYLIETPDSDFDDEDSELEYNDLREKLGKVKGRGKKSDDGESDDAENDADGTDDEQDELEAEAEDDEGEDEEESDEEGEEEDDDDDDEEDDAEEDSEDEVEQPKAKQPKLDKKLEKKPQQNGVAEKKDKPSKKDKKDNQKQQQKAAGERVLSGGVKIEDIRVGNGPEAVRGKRAQVLYEGRLKSNNRVFDSIKSGAGFKFGIGRGEVIKAWDIGVVGMKVGGKRRITCPPHMAYGARGHPPTIPPNSTLVFEVELKGVN